MERRKKGGEGKKRRTERDGEQREGEEERKGRMSRA